MADGLYLYGKQMLLEGEMDWLTHDIRAVLVDVKDPGVTGYDVALAADQFLSNIPAGNRLGEIALTSKTTATPTPGTCDAADATILSVAAVVAPEMAVVIYRFVTVDGNSPLLAYIDSAGGLTSDTDGSNVLITWNSGANRIFTL